jgi:hypothetical protein
MGAKGYNTNQGKQIMESYKLVKEDAYGMTCENKLFAIGNLQ